MLYQDALAHYVTLLNKKFENGDSNMVLEAVLQEGVLGRVALVSSFGAESAILIHMAAQIRKDFPILFIDTGFLFPETITYLETLAQDFGLSQIVHIKPDPAQIAFDDPDGTLHKHNVDQCCYIRKRRPLQQALAPYAGWITGRKRFQNTTRAHIDIFELDRVTSRIKINPLAHWTPEMLKEYRTKHHIPMHPLVKKHYPSIGCWPCTTPVINGEDSRAGRWRGLEKTECGIHFENGTLVPNGNIREF